ncbi:RNA-directed DNA polymerase [Tanacetum coccineum]
METQNSTELKKILDTMEADKREMAQRMKAMQDQIQELLLSQTHGEDSNSHGSVNKGGSSGWHSNDIKVDIPKYDGKLNPDEFVEWIRTRERMGKEKIRTWPKMKAKIKQKFLPPHHIQASFSQLHSLKQGAGSAEDYSREFEYLLMKCDIPEDDPQTLVCNLGGLEPPVSNVVRTSDPDEEVVGPDVGELLVVRRALSSTPVREEKLQYKIWCDVIPIDACHVLLGRPWQFDRRVIHDGYLNTYSFVHNNRKIVLTPIDPTTTPLKSTLSLSTLLKYEQHEYRSAKEFILLGLDEEENKPHPNTHPLF